MKTPECVLAAVSVCAVSVRVIPSPHVTQARRTAADTAGVMTTPVITPVRESAEVSLIVPLLPTLFHVHIINFVLIMLVQHCDDIIWYLD